MFCYEVVGDCGRCERSNEEDRETVWGIGGGIYLSMETFAMREATDAMRDATMLCKQNKKTERQPDYLENDAEAVILLKERRKARGIVTFYLSTFVYVVMAQGSPGQLPHICVVLRDYGGGFLPLCPANVAQVGLKHVSPPHCQFFREALGHPLRISR